MLGRRPAEEENAPAEMPTGGGETNPLLEEAQKRAEVARNINRECQAIGDPEEEMNRRRQRSAQ